jgi:hypothetical protein
MLASRPALSLASPVGNGQTALVFSLSEDAWHGDVQAALSFDGQHLGGVCTISASHALNQTQKLSFLVTLSAGPHTASVAFLNDAYGGMAAADRNLYVSSIEVGVQRVATAATFYTNGAKSFAIPAAVPANSMLMHMLLPST